MVAAHRAATSFFHTENTEEEEITEKIYCAFGAPKSQPVGLSGAKRSSSLSVSSVFKDDLSAQSTLIARW